MIQCSLITHVRTTDGHHQQIQWSTFQAGAWRGSKKIWVFQFYRSNYFYYKVVASCFTDMARLRLFYCSTRPIHTWPAVITVFTHVFRPYICPYVRPHFSKPSQHHKFQIKTIFTTSETVGMTEWIIDDSCLVINLGLNGFNYVRNRDNSKAFLLWEINEFQRFQIVNHTSLAHHCRSKNDFCFNDNDFHLNVLPWRKTSMITYVFCQNTFYTAILQIQRKRLFHIMFHINNNFSKNLAYIWYLMQYNLGSEVKVFVMRFLVALKKDASGICNERWEKNKKKAGQQKQKYFAYENKASQLSQSCSDENLWQ